VRGLLVEQWCRKEGEIRVDDHDVTPDVPLLKRVLIDALELCWEETFLLIIVRLWFHWWVHYWRALSVIVRFLNWSIYLWILFMLGALVFFLLFHNWRVDESHPLNIFFKQPKVLFNTVFSSLDDSSFDEEVQVLYELYVWCDSIFNLLI
jgi:hypothetical protein